MIKYLAIPIVTLFIGCQQPTKNTVTYQGLTCSCNGSVKLILNGDKGYECKCSDVNIIPVKKYTKKRYMSVIKQKIKVGSCPTTITEIFKSKEFKKPLVICRGKLLEKGQKTRVIKVNK